MNFDIFVSNVTGFKSFHGREAIVCRFGLFGASYREESSQVFLLIIVIDRLPSRGAVRYTRVSIVCTGSRRWIGYIYVEVNTPPSRGLPCIGLIIHQHQVCAA